MNLVELTYFHHHRWKCPFFTKPG